MKLQNKTAIVTGGGRDIGRACAMRLAAEGANVAINYFLSSQADVDALVAKTVETFGGVDILVNNSGGLIARKTISEMSFEHWQAVMDLNLTSVLW